MINPQFDFWLSRQSDDIRAAVMVKWDALQTDPAIAQGHRNADYARRSLLIRFAKDEHGYA